jgi:hypothetical protein
MDEIEQFFMQLSVADRKRLVGHCTLVLGIEGGDHYPQSDDPIMALPPKVYQWLNRYLTTYPQAVLQDILLLDRA